MVIRKKYIAKTITWRIVASLITFTVTWAVTGDIKFGIVVGGFDAVIKMFAYYFHEHAWDTYLEKKGIAK